MYEAKRKKDVPGHRQNAGYLAEFIDRMISDLKTCNIFIALRTPHYLKKQYTEQECGFALALGKRILSLCIGTDPSKMGFCSVFQGASFKEGEEEKVLEYCKKQLGGRS